ncbi:MAG: hypothetical protein SPL50_02990, partial [Alloprevotella sp.]|nr:hypothetical protein [Alloprevotella sp.]
SVLKKKVAYRAALIHIGPFAARVRQGRIGCPPYVAIVCLYNVYPKPYEHLTNAFGTFSERIGQQLSVPARQSSFGMSV